MPVRSAQLIAFNFFRGNVDLRIRTDFFAILRNRPAAQRPRSKDTSSESAQRRADDEA